MKNLIKKATASLLAFAVALSSIYISGPIVNVASAAATGIKGDANADGVVNEEDLTVYEEHLFYFTNIDHNIKIDMDINYNGSSTVIDVLDYLAVKRYLAGNTATVEPYDVNVYSHGFRSFHFYTDYNIIYQSLSNDIRIEANGVLCDEYEIIWVGEAPEGVSVSDNGYLSGIPSSENADTSFSAIVLGKLNDQYVAATDHRVHFYAPSFIITTEDGDFTYGDYIYIDSPGTYNITNKNPDAQTDAYEQISFYNHNNEPGKYTINLNGINVESGDGYYSYTFISSNSSVSDNDLDIVLNGFNKISHGVVNLEAFENVTIYADEQDSLTLSGVSSLRTHNLNVKGGSLIVDSSLQTPLMSSQLTMEGGSIKSSFTPNPNISGSNYYPTGYGMACDTVLYHKGNLELSGYNDNLGLGNNGCAFKELYNFDGFYIAPDFCDIEVAVSHDGVSFITIDGSPFGDATHSPSQSLNAVGDIPGNAIEISDLIDGYQSIKFTTTSTYRYQVTIEGDGAVIKQNGSVIDDNIFVVNGGEKLPEDLSVAAKDGWVIDSITASVNGGTPAVITDITDIEITGDTVITVNTSDVAAPIINGIEDGGEYCIDATFTVTDGSDVTVEVDGVEIFADADGNYTVIGAGEEYHIVVTDADGNVAEYTVMIYSDHLSVSNNRYTDGQTHTGICDVCNANVTADHSYGKWISNLSSDMHERECEGCGHIEEAEHIYLDVWRYENPELHGKMCIECGNMKYEAHTLIEWISDDSMFHSRGCAGRCGYHDVMPHNTSNWTANEETGKHEGKCDDCGFAMEAEHDFDSGEFIGNNQHKKTCVNCKVAGSIGNCEGIWNVTKDPSCAEKGEEAMVCDICREVHTKEIAALPHQYVNGICSSCADEDPTIGESTSDNPNTGVALGTSVALIPVVALMLMARPKAKRKNK